LTILNEIVLWAEKQEDWKQDLIKRILTQGIYTEVDIKQIANMVLYKHKYIENLDIKPTKIDKNKIPTMGNLENSNIELHSLKSPQNVNAISAQSKLLFARNGLTIVYGENGVGKSGFTRILKKSCKAREVDEILPDVFKDDPSEAANALIAYSVNGQKKEFIWEDGCEPVSELSQIVVYDSKCGKVQVNDKNELIYLPGGTDIFKKLIEAINNIKGIVTSYKPAEVELVLDGINENTKIHKILTQINSQSNITDLKEMLSWNKEKDTELTEVSKDILAANETEIEHKIKNIKTKKKEIDTFRDSFLSIEKLFTNSKLQNLRTKIDEFNCAKKALDDLTKEMSEGVHIEGTGGDLWKVMYIAAKDFAEAIVDPAYTFPESGEECPLCQQKLSSDAKERLLTFQKFVEGRINKAFEQLKDWKEKAIKLLNEKEIEIKHLLDVIENLEPFISKEDRGKLNSRIKKYEKYRLKFIGHLNMTSLSDQTTIEDFDSTKIFEDAEKLIQENIIKIKGSINPEELIKKKKYKEELNSLKIASSKISEIGKYIKYLQEIKNYEKILKEFETGAISRKGSAIITNSLKKSFINSVESELKRLGGSRLPIDVQSSTKGGEPNFQLFLDGTSLPKKFRLDSVLSEGEQKIVSLAGFLAELDTAKHENGIILDDPVTSLDHKFKHKIATRLVEEAKKRQVVIFTHDISFLFDLSNEAARLSIPVHVQNIRKDGAISGVVLDKEPWHAQKVANRVVVLKDMVRKLENDKISGEDYNHRAAIIYGRLREVWERIIEEILFNGVISRFGQAVHTQQLSGVQIEDEDYRTIYFEMSKTSKYMIGHDKSLQLSDVRPQIHEINQDIKILEEYYKVIKARKNKLDIKRRASVTKPPQAELVE
tara:strand:+ start:2006 stop:4657 length:2652 start_codon:yes stop_codon:yes gene_type:complete